MESHDGEFAEAGGYGAPTTMEDQHCAAVLVARKEYAKAITDAIAAHRRVAAVLDTLVGNDLYDVEYAEGGQRVADMQRHLADAGLSLRAVEYIHALHASLYDRYVPGGNSGTSGGRIFGSSDEFVAALEAGIDDPSAIQ